MANFTPYQFEPFKRCSQQRGFGHLSPSSSDSESTDLEDPGSDLNDHRLGNSHWCLCGICQAMETATESVCCKEVGEVERKANDEGIACITQHPGFIANCLNRHVLDVSILEFVELDGPLDDNEPIHETYRYVAYRRFCRFIWMKLGKKNRKVLPSCVVNQIRAAFPSEHYAGFKYVKP